MNAIQADQLAKHFTLSIPGEGVLGSFRRTKREVRAVEDLSFAIEDGERVAFIGPNGAGKSTTIKMLSGILVPTSGMVKVDGLVPWQDRQRLSHRIGIVFGQRSQLWSHLPVRDSFTLLGAIYGVEATVHSQRVGQLSELLELERLLDTPVDRLSLGERMRCELVAALLHAPKILFLDEPTIGLDVSARALLRTYIRKISLNEQVTILLTSHDTADIAEVCDRVVVINHGRMVLDQPVRSLKSYIRRKRVHAVLKSRVPAFHLDGVEVMEQSDSSLRLEVDTVKSSVDAAIRAILDAGSVADITVEDPPLEETILQIYREPLAAVGGAS